MYSISQMCKEFKLSRSTLLYYDSIGLLKASERTQSNYRVYSDQDKERLNQICHYRKAGVPLEDISLLLASGNNEENVLKRRLTELNKEIALLRLQQKIIIEILKSKNLDNYSYMLNKETFVSVLQASGVNEASLGALHRELEKASPVEHQLFLEFLGIDSEIIREIRDCSK